MTAVLANAGKPENRRELDFYPTPPDVTDALMNFLNLQPTTIWEPACGNGAMSSVLQRHGHTVISTDLRETGFGEGGIDFLAAAPRQCGAIITNPPFNLSEEFIRKAIECAPIVAMVLKSQYWHAKKRHDLFNEHRQAWVLPLTWRPDFLFDQRENGAKGSPTMDCVWTVWIRGETEKTGHMPLAKPSGKPADVETPPKLFAA